MGTTTGASSAGSFWPFLFSAAASPRTHMWQRFSQLPPTIRGDYYNQHMIAGSWTLGYSSTHHDDNGFTRHGRRNETTTTNRTTVPLLRIILMIIILLIKSMRTTTMKWTTPPPAHCRQPRFGNCTSCPNGCWTSVNSVVGHIPRAFNKRYWMPY